MSELLAVVDLKHVIAPVCPHCGADPLTLLRLRYDFPDGVTVEMLFCAAKDEKDNYSCRAVITGQITGYQRMKPPVEPPKSSEGK
jgi:hypothetical protein